MGSAKKHLNAFKFSTKDLIIDLGNGHYSLIIDESTAVDTKKVLCLMIRYFSETKKKIVTTFYRLIEIESGDAVTLTTAFKNQILEDGLKIEKLIGIGVDGANVMVAEYSCKCLPRNLDFIVKESHNWFSYSSKRQIEYKKLYEILADKKLKLINYQAHDARLQVKRTDLAHFKFKDYIVRVEAIDFEYSFEQAAFDMNHHEVKIIKEGCRDFLISTSQIKPNITDLVAAFKNICKTVDSTVDEWNLLHIKQ
ncbi:zinc finger mym-type protein [Lasius niger]|uniref:Zinc finger mym-type protein n=1 Tax=Lasius niger TaxID=67767 RepID=A0A0J7MVC7_LASNI|nr:zinc finger mym-type protein [Lasius niger]